MLRQRKVPKRKATPRLRPLRCAQGQTCVALLSGWAAGTRFAAAQRRSDNFGQSVHEARACFAARATPPEPRRRRSLKGVMNSHSGHRCARPWVRGRAQRWPRWFPYPCGRAEKRRVWGGQGQRSMPLLPCSDSLRLSERSATSAQRVPQCRPAAEHRRLPRSIAAGTRPVGSPSFAFFSWRVKKRRCAAGRTSRPPKAVQTLAPSVRATNERLQIQ